MNPEIIPLVEQLLQWFITGLLTFKENQALTDQFVPIFQACVAEGRGPTADEWAQINAFAQSEHDKNA